MSGSEKGRQDRKTQDETAGIKPWANQPWPLIETPSTTHHITHPALHIANEVALVHNAMIRGLNSIYLQAPHVRQTQDIVDLLFLTQSWTTWLLDYHNLKESTMLPGFESVLGVPAGALASPQSRSPSAASSHSDKHALTKTANGKEINMDAKEEEEEEEVISFLLHRVYAYASATHKDPQAYNAMTLEWLLASLAEKLVPHLTEQIKRLVSMREMCFGPAAATAPNNGRGDGPLPIPMVTITRTLSSVLPPSASPSTSPPLSPSSSTFSSASPPITAVSTPAHSPPPPASLSLFPAAPRSRPNTNTNNTTSTTTTTTTTTGSGNNQTRSKPKPNPVPASDGGRDMAMIDKESKDRLARARILLETDDRANKLTQVYLAADARASAAMDRFVVLPMIVRLRDSTATQRPLSRTASSSSLSSVSSHGSGGGGSAGSRVMSGFGGVGGFGGASAEWPRLSIPAVHAIADTLSPRHAGAWRFLPCNVWGRPRELPFLDS